VFVRKKNKFSYDAKEISTNKMVTNCKGEVALLSDVKK
jgi:hypothetical protein